MDECLEGGGGLFRGAEGPKSQYPCSWLKCTIRGSSEIELLCLHVGSRVEAERSSLSGFGDQAGIFVNLEGVDETRDVRSGQREEATREERRGRTYVVS